MKKDKNIWEAMRVLLEKYNPTQYQEMPSEDKEMFDSLVETGRYFPQQPAGSDYEPLPAMANRSPNSVGEKGPFFGTSTSGLPDAEEMALIQRYLKTGRLAPDQKWGPNDALLPPSIITDGSYLITPDFRSIDPKGEGFVKPIWQFVE